jgi:hypothetical protein
VALQLKRSGIARVRPLEGGLAVWMDRQFPVAPIDAGLPVNGREALR